jgi:antitoxin HicB
MENYRKTVAWSEEDEAWIATAPDFPTLSAAGATEEEALAELRDALAAAIETYEQEGWKLPGTQKASAEYSGQLRLRLPKSLHARAAWQAEVDGVSLNALLQSFIALGLGGKQVQSGVALYLSSESRSRPAELMLQAKSTPSFDAMESLLMCRNEAFGSVAGPLLRVMDPQELARVMEPQERQLHGDPEAADPLVPLEGFYGGGPEPVKRFRFDLGVPTLPRKALK